jgi:2-dehydro-3-deoxy-D-gluconate 5-dehydrogenase
MTHRVQSNHSPSFRLDGRFAVITGASRGIGKAFAIAYGRAGAEVMLVSRSTDELAKVQQEIESAGGKAYIWRCNVADVADVRVLGTAVADVLGSHQKLVLVNNAGAAHTKLALEVTEDDWQYVFDTNVKSTFFCAQVVGRLMLDRGYGKIINITSTWAESTDDGKSVYGAAKAAVSQLTKALSAEWAQYGVRVNAIAPTATMTDSTVNNLTAAPDRADRILQRIRLGRFAEPADLIGAAVFLASPASDFVTGHVLHVDGGWRGR